MKNFKLLLCILLAGLYSCNQNPYPDKSVSKEVTTEKEVTISETEKAINQLITDAYKVITFKKGTTPDYVAMKSIFTPKATLINFREDSLNSYYIDEFIEEFKAGNFAGELTAFDEVELGGETEYFGKIGHRISAYATKFNGAEEVGERGVNSFQVVKVNGKWLINSIIWDIEKSGQPIPKRYITGK